MTKHCSHHDELLDMVWCVKNEILKQHHEEDHYSDGQEHVLESGGWFKGFYEAPCNLY